MLVQPNKLTEVLSSLSTVSCLSLDTETTGLRPYGGDRLFSIIIGTANEEYYFNYNSNYNGGVCVLERDTIRHLLDSFTGTIFLHNAKYDMHFLRNEGLDLTDPRFTIHCTQAIGRLENNDRLSYSLDALAKECLGVTKDDKVKEYANKHKLFTWHQIPGKKKREKQYHYERVPFDIMLPYGKKDARITYDLGMYQINKIKKLDEELPDNKPKLWKVVENERGLTKTLFKMERNGVRHDAEFCSDALSFEKARIQTAMDDFERETGIVFKDSNKVLAQAFDQLGESYPTTEKGNPSFKDEVLSQIKHPLGKIIQDYRDANKKAYTYYATFLDLCDTNGRLHPNFRQGGTATGRMSCSDPNMQQVHKIEEGDERYEDKFLTRRCFIPNPDSYLFMLDFSQQEYRLMLDYAGEMAVIEEIIGGKDVHQATADIMGVTRSEAKTINFMLLYGGGIQKLADALGVSFDEAKEKRENYFRKLPKVQRFIRNVIDTCKRRGYVFNWYGRRSYVDRDFAYKAPNYLIQGGCADIVKVAMNSLEKEFRGTGVDMLLQIHDEVVFSVPKGMEDKMWKAKEIMEKVYPHKRLPMAVDVEWSEVSWQDKKLFEEMKTI